MKKLKQSAELMHSDNDLGLKLEPAVKQPRISGPEAGASNDELYASGHAENGENGSPVYDGNLKSPERQNVNAIREALETQVEMEVGKDVTKKQQEVAMQEKVQDAALAQGAGALVGGATEVNAKPGTQIIINVGSKNGKLMVQKDKDAGFREQRVLVTEGSGLDSGKEGIIIPWNDPRAKEALEDYPFVGGRTPEDMGWVAILADDGEVFTVPKTRTVVMKRSAEPIDDSKITGHAGGMFGGSDLQGPSFHVGFTIGNKRRTASFKSFSQTAKFVEDAALKFGAKDWTMKGAAVDATKKALVLEWLKTKHLSTGEVEKRLGGGKYSNIAYPILQELAKEGLIKHKQMRWYLNASSKVAAGWANWETEMVNLFIMNDKKSRDMWWNLAEKAVNSGTPVESLAEEFKQVFTPVERQFIRTQNVHQQEINRFTNIAPINWLEIAQSAVNYVKNERSAKNYDMNRNVPAEDRFKKMLRPSDAEHAHGMGISLSSLRKKGGNMPQKGSPEWHQLQIAIKTLKMPDPIVGVLGEPSKESALKTLARYGLRWDDADYMAGGTGVKKAGIKKTCPQCRGTGETRYQDKSGRCGVCHGTLKVPEDWTFSHPDLPKQSGIRSKKQGEWVDGYWKGPMKDGYPEDYFEENSDKMEFPWQKHEITKTRPELEKEAGFNLFFPGQVLQEFYPEIQHQIVDYPNANNSPMGLETPEIVGDAGHELEGMLDTALGNQTIVEAIQLPADVSDPISVSAADYVSTSPAGGMGIGRDGKPEVLEGAPLRKEPDIRGPMFTPEFYGQYQGVPGEALRVASRKTAAGGEKEQFAKFLSLVCGEIAATLIEAFKITQRPLLDKIPGVGELQLDQIEQGNAIQPTGSVKSGGRVRYLMDKLNDGDIREAINRSKAQGAVWNDSPEGGFVYEVFVRPENIDTNSMKLTYKFVTGTRES